MIIVSNPAGTTSAFRANKNAVDQTGVASATFTQVSFGNEVFDFGNNFASDAWTPPAGYVSLQFGFFATGTITVGSLITGAIYKNGSVIVQGVWFSGTNQASAFVATTDNANGSDVYTAYAYVTTSAGTATLNGAIGNTWFAGRN